MKLYAQQYLFLIGLLTYKESEGKKKQAQTWQLKVQRTIKRTIINSTL